MPSEKTQVIHYASGPALSDGPFAIISDIHSNLTALTAVMEDIAGRGITDIVCLGDTVGYGPDPIECWHLVKDSCRIIIMGNHDLALVSPVVKRFHPRALSAIEWTRDRIGQEDNGEEIMNSIADLPRSYATGEYLFVHGSPAGKTMDYLLPSDAFDRPRMEKEFHEVAHYAFNGHTHIPGVIEQGQGFQPPEALADGIYQLGDQKAVINVGSVGQPRDGNPRACYVTVSDRAVSYHRIDYDVAKVCERIFAEPRLDPFLGKRLFTGR